MSRHTGSCATSMSPGCDCCCAHARHGLAGRLLWAQALRRDEGSPNQSSISQEAHKRKADAAGRLEVRIAQAKRTKRSCGLSRVNTNAAFEFARSVDMVEWLVRHPAECEQLSAIVELLVATSEKLVSEAPVRQRASLRKRLLDHLWCDLVASIVCAVEETVELESSIKGVIAEVIADTAVKLLADSRSRKAAGRLANTKSGKTRTRADLDIEAGLSLESAIIKGCIRGIIRIILDSATAPLDAYLKSSLLQLRIAAVMLCPDVMMHSLIWDHCWLPLWHDAIFDAALDELAESVTGLKPSDDRIGSDHSTQ